MSETHSKQNKDMHKCSSVYSERGSPEYLGAFTLFLDEPTEKKRDASPPAQKAHAREQQEKACSISSTCELPLPVRDKTKKRLTTKQEWG
jgi:hypothetical protein